MRILKDQLASYIAKHQTNWDEFLSVIAFAYRTTVNTATGYTPFYLLYGREASSPTTDHYDNADITIAEYSQNLRDSLVEVWESVSKEIVAQAGKYNDKPKSFIQFRPYTVGELFYLSNSVKKRFFKDLKLSRSLQYRYSGPYRVTEVLSPILYEADIHNKLRIVHAINMKKY